MKLIPGNPCVTGAVKISNEQIHQIEKSILVRIVIGTVEPIDKIAPELLVERGKVLISCAGRAELFSGIKTGKIFFQVCGKRYTQKVVCDTYLIGNI